MLQIQHIYTDNTEITKGVPECNKQMYIYDTIKWYDDTDETKEREPRNKNII